MPVNCCSSLRILNFCPLLFLLIAAGNWSFPVRLCCHSLFSLVYPGLLESFYRSNCPALLSLFECEMARAMSPSPLASYTVVPLTSPWPGDDIISTHTLIGHTIGEESIYEVPKKTSSTFFHFLLCLILVFMIIGTIVGNALVCLAVLLVRKLKQPANFLLVSLAVADFFVGLLVMPLAAVDLMFSEWPLGPSMCKLWTTADLTLCTASIINLCAISVDRYLVISRPLRYSAMRTKSRIVTYIVVVWLIAALVSLSSLIIAKLLDDPLSHVDERTCQVIQHFAYQIYATIISFYGPTLIMLILYVKIWRAAKRLAKQDRLLTHCNGVDVDRNGNEQSDLLEKEISDNRKSSTEKKERTPSGRLFKSDRKYLHRPSALLHAVKVPLIRHNDKSECKARKTLGVIMSVFIICWFPFFFLAILKSCLGYEIPQWLDNLTLWLGYSNSTLNPAIYCKYNKEFRVPFREMLSCRCGTLQNVMRQQSFTSRYGPAIRLQQRSTRYQRLDSRKEDSHAGCSDV